jgi:predicted GIY-YIG superfamily endonuclease
MPVYLIHFERKLHHAGHYLGYTQDLEARIRSHRLGTGAKLMKAIKQSGIPWQVVRVWDGGRDLEQALKAWKNSPRFCPVCMQAALVHKLDVPALPRSDELW